MSVRRRLLERLKTDLMGPSYGETEQIEDRPSDRYFTGILFPQKLEMANEEDEKLEEVQAGKIADSDTGGSGNVSILRSIRPATAGISFALSHADGTPSSITIAVSAGQYSTVELGEACERETGGKENPIQGEQPQEHSTADVGVQDTSKTSKKCKRRWIRDHKACSRTVALEQSIQEIDLGTADDAGSETVPGLALFIKTVKIDDKIAAVTVQAINQNKRDDSSTRDDVEQQAFFQFEMNISPVAPTKLVPRPIHNIAIANDEDAKDLRRLFTETLSNTPRAIHARRIGSSAKTEW